MEFYMICIVMILHTIRYLQTAKIAEYGKNILTKESKCGKRQRLQPQ